MPYVLAAFAGPGLLVAAIISYGVSALQVYGDRIDRVGHANASLDGQQLVGRVVLAAHFREA